MLTAPSRPITLLAIVALFAVALAVPITASAADHVPLPGLQEPAPTPGAELASSVTPAIDIDECPMCWFAAGILVTVVVAVIDNSDGPIATAVTDAITYVADNLEGCTVAGAGCNP